MTNRACLYIVKAGVCRLAQARSYDDAVEAEGVRRRLGNMVAHMQCTDIYKCRTLLSLSYRGTASTQPSSVETVPPSYRTA